MGLDDLVRNGVATANRLTRDLQPTVRWEAWVADDDTGKPTYASAKGIKAIVERRARLRRRSDGQEILSQHTLLVLEVVKPNGAAGRQEPFDTRDRFTLPDGSTGPVVEIVGMTDAGSATGARYFSEILLG